MKERPTVAKSKGKAAQRPANEKAKAKAAPPKDAAKSVKASRKGA